MFFLTKEQGDAVIATAKKSMKHCPNCNAYFEDAASFCADCGLALMSEPVYALAADAEAPQGEPPLYEDDSAMALESAETISPAPQDVCYVEIL